MTSQQKQKVINETRENDRQHEEKTRRERELQQNRVKDFGSTLSGLDNDTVDNLRRAKMAAAEHNDMMNQMRSAENDAVREKNTLHAELMKEMGKNANRDVEAVQSSEAASQKTMMEHQSAEKRRIEENRKQADKEAAEKIQMARAETAKTAEIAHEHDKERTERLIKVDKEHSEEIGAMKRELLANDKLENGRQQQHAKTLECIDMAQIGARVSMNTAEEQMRKNRENTAEISKVTDGIVGLQRTLNELSAKIAVAHKLKKPQFLEKQYSIILRLSEQLRTKRTAVETQIGELRKINIDSKDEDRQLIMNNICEQLKDLNTLGEVINGFSDGELDMDSLEVLLGAVNDAVGVMTLVKTDWDNLPGVDQTNLMHNAFLGITGTLMNSAKLAAVKGGEAKAIQE